MKRGAAVVGAFLLAASALADAPASDPLAAEIARWSAFATSGAGGGEIGQQVKSGALPLLEGAERALRGGERLLALQRLAAAREGLKAAEYLESRPPEVRKDVARFEAEWLRAGEELGEALRAPSGGALEGLRPAAVRALGEASLPQARVYYEASLEYGRATMPDAGLYYIGAARAQRELPGFLRTLPAPDAAGVAAVRDVSGELDALEAAILAAYRPPLSLDRHPEFIRASSALKEARELESLGLRHGALLRYLQAAQRSAGVRASGAVPELGYVAARLGALEARLAGPGRDHSIGRLFLETARDLVAPGPQHDPAGARAIVDDVLPRYFAALEPAAPRPARPAPRVTVTLVRWPYT